jgi:LAO/AO transport system kinase
MSLLEELRAGSTRALARTITLVENGDDRAPALLDSIHPDVGSAYRIGVTGPPGAGKSTLVGALTQRFAEEGAAVGIIAVDPSSPFTGGALLGDRIRMYDAAAKEGVFIRSMASRGELGGLSKTAQEVADLMDAAGKDPILLETVGAGQAEVEVAKAADTTLVVLSPESGDSVQALKAGMMEIADVYVLNKADREGAGRLAVEIESMLDVRQSDDAHRPPVVKTVARDGDGIEELAEAIAGHRAFLEETGRIEDRRRARYRQRIRGLVDAAIMRQMLARSDRVERMVDAVLRGEETPRKAAEKILEELGL